jgi:hypothetical protein
MPTNISLGNININLITHETRGSLEFAFLQNHPRTMPRVAEHSAIGGGPRDAVDGDLDHRGDLHGIAMRKAFFHGIRFRCARD